MTETVPAKADAPIPVASDLTGDPIPAVRAAAKKKATYRPQKSGVTEQILEAVAATKERQDPKLGVVKKTISAASYGTDKVGARPNQSGSAFVYKSTAAEDGTCTSVATLLPVRDPEPSEPEGEQGEAKDRNKRNITRKAPARIMGQKRATGAKPAAQKRAKIPAAKSPRKRTAAKKVSKRPPASRTGRRQRRVARKK